MVIGEFGTGSGGGLWQEELLSEHLHFLVVVVP